MSHKEDLKFATFASFIEPGFWTHLSQLKLDVVKLSDEPIPIFGTYVNTDPPGLPCRLCIDFTAFENKYKQSKNGIFEAEGILVNTNTLEDFKKRDKVLLMSTHISDNMWANIRDRSALKNPKELVKFLILTFADLKNYHYYYWVTFPAFAYPLNMKLLSQPCSLATVLDNEAMSSLIENYIKRDRSVNASFFTVAINNKMVTVHPLNAYESLRENVDKVWLCFADPCTLPNNPGWPLRNLLTLAIVCWNKKWSTFKVLCLRQITVNGVMTVGHSLYLEVDLGSQDLPADQPLSLGWEKNEKGKMGPRFVNMSASMDPVRLAESAVSLNLKLMKWRVVPSLNLAIFHNTKCLLLGAGTLGCNVARCLLGWGVQNITFLDCGNVSYSNPVRQSLFVFEDCQGGSKKAEAAAVALTKIFPSVKARGVSLSIPMPGHPVGLSQINAVQTAVKTLEQLVDDHDILFLLTDSRESRWLPTVLGSAKNKFVFTAALGFDSFVVMRHGIRGAVSKDEMKCENNLIFGDKLGCYFCGDVVAPGDSLQDRTLDQQCTVSRPGMSMMAAAHVVELMASLLQHPLQGLAPAFCGDEFAVPEGVLGPVPHSLRYFLGRFHHFTPVVSLFHQCSACSATVLQEYTEKGFDFLIQVFSSSTYLEHLVGLDVLQKLSDCDEIWDISDDETADD